MFSPYRASASKQTLLGTTGVKDPTFSQVQSVMLWKPFGHLSCNWSDPGSNPILNWLQVAA